MAARPQGPDVYAGLFSPDLDDVAERLDQAARRAVGVSCMCPGEAPEGDGQADEHVENDRDEGSSGVSARAG